MNKRCKPILSKKNKNLGNSQGEQLKDLKLKLD